MSSLDISRRNLALRGKESFAKVVEMASYAREEINDIGGYYAYGKELVNGGSVYDFDVTKLSVYTRDIGLAGIEVYDLLRDEYDIQIRIRRYQAIFLAYISIGDRIQDIERFVGALGGYKTPYMQKIQPGHAFNTEYIAPKVVTTPQKAFYAAKGIASDSRSAVRTRLRRIRHVLSSRDTHTCSRRGGNGRNNRLYRICHRKRAAPCKGTEDPDHIPH